MRRRTRTHPPPPLLRERLAASDALVLPGQSPRVCIERVGAFGRSAPSQGESLVILDRGAEGPPLQHAHGVVTVPQAQLAQADVPRGILLETRGAMPESALARLIPGLPTLSALKRRNHRKFLIFDGRTAVITGRNLGAPYYRGFGETALSVHSQYRDVPWLDCGAEFAGPLVNELEQSFCGSGRAVLFAGVAARRRGRPCRAVLRTSGPRAGAARPA